MSEEAPNLHNAALAVQIVGPCIRCQNIQKWAFYAGCCASFTCGLLGGMCAVAVAWSHLGG